MAEDKIIQGTEKKPEKQVLWGALQITQAILVLGQKGYTEETLLMEISYT